MRSATLPATGNVTTANERRWRHRADGLSGKRVNPRHPGTNRDTASATGDAALIDSRSPWPNWRQLANTSLIGGVWSRWGRKLGGPRGGGPPLAIPGTRSRSLRAR